MHSPSVPTRLRSPSSPHTLPCLPLFVPKGSLPPGTPLGLPPGTPPGQAERKRWNFGCLHSARSGPRSGGRGAAAAGSAARVAAGPRAAVPLACHHDAGRGAACNPHGAWGREACSPMMLGGGSSMHPHDAGRGGGAACNQPPWCCEEGSMQPHDAGRGGAACIPMTLGGGAACSSPITP